jgi:NAD(P)-dependent dehydrogenase (short-subunit alcohol dehydrogenase family)
MPSSPTPAAALVTGGARRIGRAITLALADTGTDVIVHYRSSQQAAQETVARAEKLGVEACTVQANLADDEQRATLLDEAETQLGRPPNVLVNNASSFPETTLAEADKAEFEAMMNLHAWAPLELTRRLAERVDEAAVVNLLDTRVATHDPDHVPYILSKKTLKDVTETLATELAPSVRVNAVAPGAILPPEGAGEDLMQRIAEQTPLARTGNPEEVARAVTYLVEARFVTGQTIFVDGGRHIP